MHMTAIQSSKHFIELKCNAFLSPAPHERFPGKNLQMIYRSKSSSMSITKASYRLHSCINVIGKLGEAPSES